MPLYPSTTSPPSQQTRAWVVLRLVVGVLPLITAGLKARQLLTGPFLGDFWRDTRLWQAAAVGVEVALARWIWSGLLPRLTRWLGA